MQLRLRTWKKHGRQKGQPYAPPTDPRRIPHKPPLPGHTCSECFGPRSHYGNRLFCSQCQLKLFGEGTGYGYDHFIRSERARNRKKPHV